ncbi:MAG: LysM peptidoglycan-binding domain-containing protein [Chloroflexi bacterium]|nr:LysM peptidoglycan-binding domain-containing protein [Chloroflexota bacterium]
MMHERWQNQLLLYVAGTLSPDERIALEQHLATCPACRVALHEWRLIADAVHTDVHQRVEADHQMPALPPLRLPPDAVPPDVLPASPPLAPPPPYRNGKSTAFVSQEDQTMQITLTQPNRRVRRNPLRWNSLRQVPITLAAALLLIAAFGGLLLFFSTRSDSTPGAFAPAADGGRNGAHPPAGDEPESGGQPALAQNVTATLVPTGTALPFTAQPARTLSPPTQLPEDVMLTGIRYEAQEWNNQGPATLAMALSYYGWEGDQNDIADVVRPNREDKSVTPAELVDYVNTRTGYRALARLGGTVDTLRTLVGSGYPVIIEVGFTPEEDWLGHYQLVMGYTLSPDTFYVYDSFQGNNQGDGLGYESWPLTANWQAFNNSFIVVYPPADEARVRSLLGPLADPTQAVRAALTTTQSTLASKDAPRLADGWLWFNVGASYVALGDYVNAAVAFDVAIGYGGLDTETGLPWRVLWYRFEPYEAYYHIGRYDDVTTLAAYTLDATQDVEQAHYWYGMALVAQGELDEARTRFEDALQANANYAPAQLALGQLNAGQPVMPFQTGPAGQIMVEPTMLAPTVLPQAVTPPALLPSGTALRVWPYTVQPGDTCLSIAFMYGHTDPAVIVTIQELNNIDCDQLQVGSTLLVPDASRESSGTLPTPTLPPTVTFMPSPTVTPSATFTPTPTRLATETFAPTPSLTPTATHTSTPVVQ